MMGRQDGADVVAKGEGKSFEEMNAWYEQVHQMKQMKKTGVVDLEFIQ